MSETIGHQEVSSGEHGLLIDVSAFRQAKYEELLYEGFFDLSLGFTDLGTGRASRRGKRPSWLESRKHWMARLE